MMERIIREETNEVVISHNRKFFLLKTLSTNSTGGLKIRAWLLVVLGFLLTCLIVINTIITGQYPVSHQMNTVHDNDIDTEIQLLTIGNKKSDVLVDNEGCRIAALDPLDAFSKSFIEIAKPIECEFGNELPLVESNETHLFINPKAVPQYNITEIPNCCWKEFQRTNENDDDVVYESDCHPFQSSTRVPSEFVKVECEKDGVRIYRDYHNFVPRKPQVEERCRNSIKHQKLSVLILGLDAVSRLNFHRMMPKTVQILEKNEAIEMLGYTKVADNTYPNLIPVLTGLSDTEFHSVCHRDRSEPFDDCPLLWKNFSSAGYRTVFAEDACDMTIFNFHKPGFREQPTDYYLRPYCVATEGDIGNTYKLTTNLCVGTRKNYENLLNYTNKIVRTFPNDNYFAFFWQASMSHDFFNYPQLGDGPYSEMIKEFYANQLMNNTALIVMSDHGIRYGKFRQTYRGRIEDSLPFVFIIFPEWWRKRYPIALANLRRNTMSLTTPFDLHETLKDILMPEQIDEDNIRKRTRTMSSMKDDLLPRGISWFLPIPGHRTCDLAGIPGHWCMCHKSRNISVDNEIVKKITNYLVDELNSMVVKYPQCGKLTMKNVIDAKIWTQSVQRNQRDIPWTDYTVSMETVPGNAIFEASIRHSNNGANELLGSVSRLNTYGNQSACVDDYKMRLYCYCL